jgi:hypothetical protein
MRYIQFSASAFGSATKALEDARKLKPRKMWAKMVCRRSLLNAFAG